MQLNHNRHAVYKLTYHLVVATKYRHPVINEPIKKRLEEVARHLFGKWNCDVLGFNSDKDHIHILFDAPPQLNIANSINSFKTVSSRYIRKEFAEYLEPFYWKPYFWSRSYLIITTGGAPLEVIKKYIQHQGQDREG